MWRGPYSAMDTHAACSCLRRRRPWRAGQTSPSVTRTRCVCARCWLEFISPMPRHRPLSSYHRPRRCLPRRSLARRRTPSGRSSRPVPADVESPGRLLRARSAERVPKHRRPPPSIVGGAEPLEARRARPTASAPQSDQAHPPPPPSAIVPGRSLVAGPGGALLPHAASGPKQRKRPAWPCLFLPPKPRIHRGEWRQASSSPSGGEARRTAVQRGVRGLG